MNIRKLYRTLPALLLIAAAILFSAPARSAAAEKVTLANGKAPKIVCLIAENEYHAKDEVPKFMDTLKAKYGFNVVYLIKDLDKKSSDSQIVGLPNMQEVVDADLLYVQTRRQALPADQMKILHDYVASGRPVIGVRTASHAFVVKSPKPEADAAKKEKAAPAKDAAKKEKAAPAKEAAKKKAASADNLVEWPDFDAQVLGCHYSGHYGKTPEGTKVTIAPGAENNPILAGVPKEGFNSPCWMYRLSPLMETSQALLIGTTAGKPAEPVALINTANGRRVFSTSLGHWDDWKIPGYQRMLTNAIFWCLNLPAPKDM